MKGHVRQRSKNSWSIVIDLPRDPVSGKRCQQWHTVKGTRRDAERALREIQTAIDKGAYVKPNRITLGEWLIQWLESYVTTSTTPRTYESYREAINKHIIPGLGMNVFSDLEPLYIQMYYGQYPILQTIYCVTAI